MTPDTRPTPRLLSAALLALSLLAAAPSASAQDQGALFYSGEFNDFGAAPMTYLTGPDNWVVTIQATADDAESNFLYRDSDSNFDNKWSRGDQVNFDEVTTWFWQGGDGRINATSGLYYTFIAQDVPDGDNSLGSVLETGGPLSTITSVTRERFSPRAGEPTTVNVTLSAPAPEGQGIYFRFTTDAFATSTVTELTCDGAASCTADLPATSAGTTVTYYAFSSADGLSLTGANADRFTANLNNNGGANYSYVARAAPTVQGAEGWRMVSIPKSGATVADLAALSRVQGVAESFPTAPDNVFAYASGAYVGPTSLSNTVASGTGRFWYLRDGGPEASTDFPFVLDADGSPAASAVGTALSDPTDNILGNPFRADYNVGAITADGGTFQNDVSIWDPNAAGTTANGNTGSYLTRSRAGNETVSEWQAFWVESADGATSATFPLSGRVAGAGTPFVGRTGESLARLRFRLDGDGVADHSASLVLAEAATTGFDVYDLSKRTPLAQTFVALAFGTDGALRATESLPTGTSEAFAVPVSVESAGYAGALTLTWAPAEAALPAGWSFLLRDLVTGQTVDLMAATSYTFEVAPTQAARTEAEVAAALGARLERAATRFTLSVGPASLVSAGDAPSARADAITTLGPNPATGAVRVGLDVAAASEVSLVVVDLLGRTVLTQDLGQVAPGARSATVDTSALPSGAYLVRLIVDGAPADVRRLVTVR